MAGVKGQRERQLSWEGCFNVRDLGGLPAADGRSTRWAAVIRADALDGLSASGWRSAWDHGVRTVVDLRNDAERGEDRAPRPPGLTTIHIPLDVSEDREFWKLWATGPQFGTPLYYGPHLERFPDRSVAVVKAIAHAPAGGVVFHCGGGRDRAGQIAILLLALVGVPTEEIAADYCLSTECLRVRYASRGEPDQGIEIDAFLASRGETAGDLVVRLLREIDVPAHLQGAGLTDADVDALRRRLLG